MKRDSSSVYQYKGWRAFQTRDENDNLQPLLILRKENQEVELTIDIHATISDCVHAIEDKINAMA